MGFAFLVIFHIALPSLLFLSFDPSVSNFPLMASSQQKGCLTYEGTSLVLVPTGPNMWPFFDVAKDSFWVTVGEHDVDAAAPYEGEGEPYQIPCGDNNGGYGIFINPRFLLRM